MIDSKKILLKFHGAMRSSHPAIGLTKKQIRRARCPHRAANFLLTFLASLAGEVASAACAEVGGVNLDFIKLFIKPLSHGQAVTAPLNGRLL